MRFLIADGKIIEKKDIVFSDNYADILFRLYQKMWYGYGGIPLFTENINMLEIQARTLKIPIPGEFQNKRELFRLVKRILNKNKFYRSGHVNLQLIAGIDSIHTTVTCTAFPEFNFPFEDEGLLVDFSNQKKYSTNTISRMAFFNERLWQSSLAEIQGTQFKQSVILNERNMVCEGAGTNLFMIAGKELITPSFSSGCHENVIRPIVMEAAINLGLKVEEKASVTPDELLEADELFYASEQFGIQWILGIRNQRFIHYYSRIINKELNVILKSRAALNSL